MDLNKDNILIIIPVYNEENTIRKVVSALVKKGYKHILVVDDGSTQDILAVLQELPVVYMRHAVNLGQGAALQSGFDYAKKSAVSAAITFDADGQHDVDDLEPLLLPLLLDQADIVFGSRFLQNTETGVPVLKKAVLTFARVINFIFSGLLLSDAHNGLRALNGAALEKIQMSENRMAHASEILFETRKKGLRFKEVPVHIRYTRYSKQKGQSAWDSIKILIDLVLHKLFK